MILGASPLTMSSREIAELTGKEPSHVNRDIRAMLDALADDPELDHVREEKDALRFEGIYSDSYGRGQPCFNLPKDLTITLVAGYNVKVRHAIVTRWQELEAQQTQAFAIPKSLPEALRLAADLSEQNERCTSACKSYSPPLRFSHFRVQTKN